VSEEMFGPEPEATGSSDVSGEGMTSGVHDLGSGTFIRVPEEVIRGLLRRPDAVAAIKERGKKVADLANSNHITKGAEYEAVYVDNPDYKRPTVMVKPANFKGVIDEATHSTLLKAAAQVGSDPMIQPGGSTESGNVT
jgi:hypothetical protein